MDWYLDFFANPIGYQELRDAVGYIPQGALKRDLNHHEAIESLIATHLSQAKPPKKRQTKAKREECTTLRIIRDTGLARTVKRLHSFRCQVCGERIELPNGTFYAEAHHIHPLGTPHNGHDVIENILCVCPNHHAQLDYLAIRLIANKLRTHPNHSIDVNSIAHHNKRCDAAGLPK